MMDSLNILRAKILIVDDEEVHIHQLERMLWGAGYVSFASIQDPAEVFALHLKNHYDLILLDLEMPGLDGFQVMERLKGSEKGGYLPVLALASLPAHKLRALQAGARDFITKPFELGEVLARVHNMLEMRLLHQELQEYNALLEQRMQGRTAELQESYLETIFTMTRAAEHKDEDTGAHVQRISYYNRELARLLGMDEDFVDNIFFASPMHDIGKIGIPDHVLLKTSSLTPEEWIVMKEHTVMGSRILGSSSSPYLKMGAEIALAHHERWDGGGYPDHLAGTDIPLIARIVMTCDAFSAMTTTRSYRAARTPAEACDELQRCAGTQFDPTIVEAILSLEFPESP